MFRASFRRAGVVAPPGRSPTLHAAPPWDILPRECLVERALVLPALFAAFSVGVILSMTLGGAGSRGLRWGYSAVLLFRLEQPQCESATIRMMIDIDIHTYKDIATTE